MELVQIFRALRARWYLVLLVIALAAGAAVAVIRSVHSVTRGSATVQLLVDSPRSALNDLQQDPTPLVTRASVFAQLMTSSSVLQSIAARARVPAAELTAEGPYSGAGQVLNVETPSEARGVQLVTASSLYHLSFVAQTAIPIVTASVLGPNPTAAGQVANAVEPGVEAWLRSLPVAKSTPSYARVTIRQLGDAQAGPVNSSSSKVLAGVASVGTLILGLLAVLALESRRTRRRHKHEDRSSPPPPQDAPPFQAWSNGSGSNGEHAPATVPVTASRPGAAVAATSSTNGHDPSPASPKLGDGWQALQKSEVMQRLARRSRFRWIQTRAPR